MKQIKFLFFVLIVLIAWAFIITSTSCVQAQELELIEALELLWQTSWAPAYYIPPDPITGLPPTLASLLIRNADSQVQPTFLYNPYVYEFPLDLIHPSPLFYNRPFVTLSFYPIFGIYPLLIP
ncbi:MAG: hypothetical protein ACMUJM_15915 [bacterium]